MEAKHNPSQALVLAMCGLSDHKKLVLMSEAAYMIHPHFPVWGIDLIPIQVQEGVVKKTIPKVYINERGAEWLVQQHIPRVQKVQAECVVDALEHPHGYARYRARVVYADGSEFIAEGSAQPGDKQARWQINEIAETRARRRAMLLSCASMLIERDVEELVDDGIALIGDNDDDTTITG